MVMNDIAIFLTAVIATLLRSFNAIYLSSIVTSVTAGISISFTSVMIYLVNELFVIFILFLNTLLMDRALMVRRGEARKNFISHWLKRNDEVNEAYASMTEISEHYSEMGIMKRYDAVYTFFTASSGIVALAILSWDIGLFSLLSCFVSLILMKGNESFTGRYNDSFVSRTEELTAVLDESFRGHDVLLSYSPWEYVSSKIRFASNGFERARRSLAVMMGVADDLTCLPPVLVYYFILGWIVIRHSSDGAAVGLIVAYLSLEGWISSSAESFWSDVNSIRSVGSLSDKFAKSKPVHDSSDNVVFKSDITISEMVLPDDSVFSYTFRKSGRYLIEGESGTGKSTILKCIIGKAGSSEGKVYLDGIPIRIKERDKILDTLSYVPQDPILFRGSLYENMVMFRNVDEAMLLNMVENFRLLDRRVSIDELKEINVDENGSNLSGGEKQKIAFIRAMLDTRGFMILDEPFRSVDRKTADMMLSYLVDTIEGFILVSHYADEIRCPDINVIRIGD